MAIKLKNMSKKWYVKAAAYLILVVCVVGSSIVLWTNKDEINLDSIWQESYGESQQFYHELAEFMRLVNVVTKYDSAEEITPELFEEDALNRLLDEPYYTWLEHDGRIDIIVDSSKDYFNFSYNAFSDDTNETIDNSERSSSDQTATEATEAEEKDETFEAFLQAFPDLKDRVQKEYANIEERKYLSCLQTLEENNNIFYQIVDRSKIKESLASFEKLPIAAYRDGNEVWQKGSYFLETRLYEMKELDDVIFVGVTQEYFDKQDAEWKNSVIITKQVVQEGCVYVAVGLLMLLYLLIITGYEPYEKKVRLYVIDRVWSEIQWGIGFLSVFGFAFCIMLCFEEASKLWLFQLTMLGAVASGTLLLVCVLSQIRRLKARRFLNGFICLRVCSRIIRKVYRGIKAVWVRGKLSKRALLLAISLPILCATWVGAPFVIALLVYMIYKYMGDFNEIVEGTKKIKDGSLTHKIVVKDGSGILGDLAENINTLSQGLEAAVSNELRSERLKAELISNVSHDLKTPLTSIVTYVDLLKQEKLENENAEKYIDVIDRKAQRLTVLTSDLFEAAKASSGAMPVNLEKVDLNAIVRQALGEFDEKIQNANLEIRTKLPEGGSYITADGKLTWRVLDNLLSNVIKYGLTGSRVYMEVEEENQIVKFTMKNISAYELNIPEQELMERFKRGDESRNSEGSGLGLSIANSLVVLQHGSFEIGIDGDLFKATICLPRYLEK